CTLPGGSLDPLLQLESREPPGSVHDPLVGGLMGVSLVNLPVAGLSSPLDPVNNVNDIGSDTSGRSALLAETDREASGLSKVSSGSNGIEANQGPSQVVAGGSVVPGPLSLSAVGPGAVQPAAWEGMVDPWASPVDVPFAAEQPAVPSAASLGSPA